MQDMQGFLICMHSVCTLLEYSLQKGICSKTRTVYQPQYVSIAGQEMQLGMAAAAAALALAEADPPPPQLLTSGHGDGIPTDYFTI